MKTRLTNLKKGEKFLYDSIAYEKCDDLNKSGYCINCKTKEKIKLPLMATVERYIESQTGKKKKNDTSDKQEMYNTRFRDGWIESRDVQPSPVSIDNDRPKEAGDN